MTAIIEAADYMESRLGGRKPQVGIILGSGLGKLADRIEEPMVIPYTDVPNFVKSTAIGHKGNFIAGTLGGKFVLAMQGRFHYYEGYPMEKVTLPVRVMVRLGIKTLFVSNAAGGVNFDFRVGDLMIIKDHINKLPNPLIGPNLEEFGPRFPDMTRPYDPKLIALAEEIGREKGIDGMSVITNEAHDDYAEDFENNGDDVVRAADAAADRMTTVFTTLIERM